MNQFYFFKKPQDLTELNKLADQQWEVVTQTPFILAREFIVSDRSRKLPAQWLELLEKVANRSKEELSFLKERGFKFEKKDGKETILYEESPGIRNWRIEVVVDEVPCIACITFGSLDMNVYTYADAEVIDSYAGEEMAEAMKTGLFERREPTPEENKALGGD